MSDSWGFGIYLFVRLFVLRTQSGLELHVPVNDFELSPCLHLPGPGTIPKHHYTKPKGSVFSLNQRNAVYSGSYR